MSAMHKTKTKYVNSDEHQKFVTRSVWVAGYVVNGNQEDGYDCDWYAWDSDSPDAEKMARAWAADVAKQFRRFKDAEIFVAKCDGYPFAENRKDEKSREFCDYADEWNPWDAQTEWHVLREGAKK